MNNSVTLEISHKEAISNNVSKIVGSFRNLGEQVDQVDGKMGKFDSAISASLQGGLACITDDHSILSIKDIDRWAYLIFRDKNCPGDQIHYFIDGELHIVERH